jgi:C1A family cysteine protease
MINKYFGWKRDLPDFRDYSPSASPISDIMDSIKGRIDPHIPASVDLRKYCSPIEDQKNWGSCTAQTAAGMVEFFERKSFGKHIEVSRKFLYKTTRNLLKWTGDQGAYLRTTMGALVLFGAPPESYFSYEGDVDEEPSAFVYSLANDYRASKYFRLDDNDPNKTLNNVKYYLAHNFPVMFGFTVYNSISQADKTGSIPFPTKGDVVVGGHAVLAIGYNDADQTLLIRNSWGEGWGDKGYGKLPYDYVLKGLAVDFWTMVNQSWIDADLFL